MDSRLFRGGSRLPRRMPRPPRTRPNGGRKPRLERKYRRNLFVGCSRWLAWSPVCSVCPRMCLQALGHCILPVADCSAWAPDLHAALGRKQAVHGVNDKACERKADDNGDVNFAHQARQLANVCRLSFCLSHVSVSYCSLRRPWTERMPLGVSCKNMEDMPPVLV